MHLTNISSLIFITIAALQLNGVLGHGRLRSPPSRSSMWRDGFNTPINYDDHQLWCGGFNAQHELNGGRCGECGEDWSLPRPRLYDEGGRNWRGIIGKNYKQGQLVQMAVELTVNHLGYFEFRLCPKSSATELATQGCFDRRLLKLSDGSTRYPIKSTALGYLYIKVQLPSDVYCDNCVIQWTYTAGNNNGVCGNGTSALGCGPQETYRNCADVAIKKV